MDLNSIFVNPGFNFLEDYKLESDMLELEELKLSKQFRRKRYVDAMYFGEINEESKKRVGKGVMIYKTGRFYEGEWLNDLRHGRGYEKYHNGNVYIG